MYDFYFVKWRFMLKDQFILLFVLSNGVTKEVFNMHLPLLCSINVLWAYIQM